ncbi:MAG: hypothetical protein ABIJ91_03600 [Candidatus Kuenenbacteria bacterium]
MQKKIILIAIIIILAAGTGYYIYSDLVEPESTTVVDSNKNQPDLDRPINFYIDIPEQAKTIYKNKIEELEKQLKNNPDFFNGWLDLGALRQEIGDYEIAKECWEYAGYIRPNNSTSFNNLGFLYGYYLNNPPKAEENYLKAIENGPNMVYIYRNLFEFYRDVLKDDTKAKNILQKGIELNPDTSQDLKYLLDNL